MDEANQEPDATENDQEAFQQPDDQGISLEDLGKAYADLVGKGQDPYEESDETNAESDAEEPEADEPDSDASTFQISPRSIVEGVLFVGHPDNAPLTSRDIAEHMRNVRPAEIDQLVEDLNAEYDECNSAYQIVAEGAGYRMALREELGSIRNLFYGKVREANLSQSAVDVLAVVAYQQGASREDVDSVRGRPSGGVLSQLVRRELLKVERAKEKPYMRYFTTERFLDLFGLDSIEDLPKSEVDRL